MARMGHDLMSTVAEDKQAAERYWVFTTCLWLLVWLLGSLPFVAADWVLHQESKGHWTPVRPVKRPSVR